MEGGSRPESPLAPPSSVAASRKKSRVELWIGPGIVIWIELRIACMQRPSKSLDYHHRGASPRDERGEHRACSQVKISAHAFGSNRINFSGAWRFHPF